MSKLLSYLIPGIVIAILLMVVDVSLIPESLHKADWFNHFMSILYIACIIVPCLIYFFKNPPGRGAQP